MRNKIYFLGQKESFLCFYVIFSRLKILQRPWLFCDFFFFDIFWQSFDIFFNLNVFFWGCKSSSQWATSINILWHLRDMNCLCLKHLFITHSFILFYFIFYRRPSSKSLWRWTSWTQSLKTTSKWRFAQGNNQSDKWLETDLCWCWCLVCWFFSFFPTSNFLSHTHWTDKEKNDRRRNGKLHNIHAGEIPRWGNLDFYFIFGPFCDRVLWEVFHFVLTRVSSPKRYIDQGQRTYSYAPVKGTDYR